MSSTCTATLIVQHRLTAPNHCPSKYRFQTTFWAAATRYPSFNVIFRSSFKFIGARGFCVTRYWVHQSTYFKDTESEFNNCHTLSLLFFLCLLRWYQSLWTFVDFPKCLHSLMSNFISSKKIIISSLWCELL